MVHHISLYLFFCQLTSYFLTILSLACGIAGIIFIMRKFNEDMLFILYFVYASVLITYILKYWNYDSIVIDNLINW